MREISNVSDLNGSASRFVDDDDRIVKLLAAYDDALARGETPPNSILGDDLAPAAAAQLAHLELKMRALRVAPKSTIAAPLGSTRRALTTAEPGRADGVISEETDELPKTLGRFEIVRRLGSGGAGVVLLARDPVLGRFVALKIPRFDALFGKELRRRFLREAQAAARLAHPNLVPVYEVGEAGAICYIASTYCEGPNLAEWLRKQPGPIAPNTAAAFVAQLAEAIDYANGEGVLHRDLKPSNVLLARRAGCRESASAADQDDPASLVPKITDFGLARVDEVAGDETRSGLLIGTPAYMSPEQAEARRADVGPATDVYGLGAILYELLASHAPFCGKSDADVLRQVLTYEPASIRRARSDVPRDLEAICLRCLEKSPARRYPTAGELATDLRRFCAGEPTRARPLGQLGTLVRWARRKPWAAALGGVILASAVIVIALSAVYVARLRDARDTADAERVRAESVAGDNAVYRYALQMRRGFELQSAGNALGAKKVLDEFRPPSEYADLRGFEWFYLNNLLRDAPNTLVGHRGHVNAVAFSPNGRQLLSGGDDGTVRGWDPATGQELFCHQAHPSCVNTLAFSPDARLLATGSCDCTIRVWDTNGWRLLTTLSGHPDRVETVAFSPTDNNRLASCGNDPVLRLWDVSTGNAIRSLDTERGRLIGLAWMSDGKTVLAAGGGAIQRNGNYGEHLPLAVWDTDESRAADGGLPEGFDSSAVTVAVAPDDSMFGVGGGGEPFVRYVRREKGNDVVVPLVGHANMVQSVTFSPDARLFASGSWDTSIRIWDTARGTCERVLSGHADRISSLAFASRGFLLASASFDGTVKLWRRIVAPVAVRRTIPARFRDQVGMDHYSELAVSADCRFVALRPTREQVNVLDLDDSNRCVARINVPSDTRLAFSFPRDDRGDILNMAGETGHVLSWNFREGCSEKGTPDALCLKPEVRAADGPHHLILSPDGRFLFDVEVPRIRMIDTRTGATLREFSHAHRWTGSVRFTPDDSMVAVSVSPDNKDEHSLFDIASGRWRSFLDSTCIANGAEKVAKMHWLTVNVFEPSRPEDVLTLHHNSLVREAAFSPEARTLATYTAAHEICLWHVATGERVAQWPTPPGEVRLLRFSADGRRLCAVTVDVKEDEEGGAREDDVYAVVWRGEE
jgi:WD40 repeat protein